MVTQFPTSDNTTTGTPKEIRHLYIQDGKVVQNAAFSVAGITPTNAISGSFCSSQEEVFNSTNAFPQQGGMVLVFSIWGGSGSGMLWLGGTYPTTSSASEPCVARGPCSTIYGNPADLMVEYPDAAVTFSNIKTNDIGSTFAATNQTTTLKYRDLNRMARQ